MPNAKEGLAGVTANDNSVGWPTFRVVELVTEPEVAVIVAAPTPVPLAEPAAEIVATAGDEELQFTELVKFCVLPSL